ncbi:hypothetical protein PHMEG_00022383 [Phytophthora megakarya]|uniref:Retrotransposon gag domain-containing protein n=1 Tax=Phytophthora megakarya TaxID=4795 RepID=A0A225VKX6_9STRA|nr:hypothetical protein PHMEG_00022383 [Phytophthora megakarya]
MQATIHGHQDLYDKLENRTSDFVTTISSSLDKSVRNWYRAFSSDCEAAPTPKTWELFKLKLRERFRPKDFEYNLCERLFQLKQRGTIHEYNGLRAETAKKVKELSPRFLHEVIEIATNFEFAHYGGQSTKVDTGPATLKPSTRSKPTLRNPKNSRDEWTKTATYHNCGQLGHIKPQCKATKETNHYISGSFYAILEVSAWASKRSEPRGAVSIFVDNGSSRNGVTEELVNRLQLDIIKDPNDLMTVTLGYNQTEQRPKRTVEMKLQIPDFPETRETFTVMPVPEGKDVMLEMKWLR